MCPRAEGRTYSVADLLVELQKDQLRSGRKQLEIGILGMDYQMVDVSMALSDEERRRLEQLNREFSPADPQLARTLRSGLVQTLPPPGSVLHGLAVSAGFGLIILGLLHLVTGSGAIGALAISGGGYWLYRLGRTPWHGEE